MENNVAPYDKTHRIHPLVLACIVVNEGQVDDMKQLIFEHEVYATFTTRARGTATSIFDEVTAGGQLRKAVIFAIMRKDIWDVLKNSIASRINISKLSKGIAYCMPLTSVMSVSVYKMFSNVRFFEKPINTKKKRRIKIVGGKSK